jgi:glycosyltransferase involved in cell wall biosynthesis
MYRIAVDARPLSFPTTGIGRYTQAVLSRLIKKNDNWKWFLYSDRGLLWSEYSPKNVIVRHPQSMLPGLGSLFSQVVYPYWCNKDKIDLFWSPRHHLPLLLKNKTKSIVTIHDLVWKNFPKTMSTGGYLLDSSLMPPSIRLANSVITVSASVEKEVQDLFPGAEVNTIYSGPFLKPEEKVVDGDYFLFVGTLEPRKNLLRLLKAYKAYLERSTVPLKLRICGGKGWGLPQLEKEIRNLGLSEMIHLLGYVSDLELKSLYKNARALVVPSLYEGFGLPIIEAFSQATPVITSNRGAMCEIAGSAGILVDPDNEEEISKALSMLAEDITLTRDFQIKGRKRAEEFSWEKSAFKTQEIMSNILTKRF